MQVSPELSIGEIQSRLFEVVRALIGEPQATVVNWQPRPVAGGFGTVAGASAVYRVSGTAEVHGSITSWVVILKVVRQLEIVTDPAAIRYWLREVLFYRSGLPASLIKGVRAPVCYGVDERADGTFWLWLEDVDDEANTHWPISRWGQIARNLGQFNGAGGLPQNRFDQPWLVGRRLRSWLEFHQPHIARIVAAGSNPRLQQWWPASVVEAIQNLWAERESFLEALEAQPQSFGHGDAIKRNLFIRTGVNGLAETVAIDWEHAGYFALGEEVGQTLSVASAFFQSEPADLPSLDEAIFSGYLAGLADVGWSGDASQVRFAYCVHAALRNIFNAVGTSVPTEDQQTAALKSQGHTVEELAQRRAEIRPFLLERAKEARTLLSRMPTD